jgi:hypothetical protein
MNCREMPTLPIGIIQKIFCYIIGNKIIHARNFLCCQYKKLFNALNNTLNYLKNDC